jgi:nucleoside-diphosphate-sugar epimerase
MEVLGDGFIATHLTHALGSRHPQVTVIAAGVSRTLTVDEAEFSREIKLVYDTIHRCRDQNRTVVFFSTASQAMYGGLPGPGTENGPVFPPSAYGRHKLALESVLARSGVSWLVLRLSHLVGPGQRPHQLLPSLITQIRSGTVEVHQNARRDLLDVRHMLSVLDCLLSTGVRDTVVNVASGTSVSVERIVAGIEHRLGVRARKLMVSKPRFTAEVSVALMRRLVAQSSQFGFGESYLDHLLDRYVGVAGVATVG